MSLESFDLTSVTSIEGNQQTKTKIPFKNGYIVITKRKFIALMTTIMLLFGLSILISIQSSKKPNNIIDNSNNFTNALKDLNTRIESLKHFRHVDTTTVDTTTNQFEKIEYFGYFKKLEKKMNYADGQKACSKLFGRIIEGEYKSTFLLIPNSMEK